jgi:hypothetical protein
MENCQNEKCSLRGSHVQRVENDHGIILARHGDDQSFSGNPQSCAARNFQRHAFELLLRFANAVECHYMEVIAVRVSDENVTRFGNVNADWIWGERVIPVFAHKFAIHGIDDNGVGLVIRYVVHSLVNGHIRGILQESGAREDTNGAQHRETVQFELDQIAFAVDNDQMSVFFVQCHNSNLIHSALGTQTANEFSIHIKDLKTRIHLARTTIEHNVSTIPSVHQSDNLFGVIQTAVFGSRSSDLFHNFTTSCKHEASMIVRVRNDLKSLWYEQDAVAVVSYNFVVYAKC